MLYTSADVRRAVRQVLASSATERVVIVGFVGSTPESYLPNPRGIRLYCWDEPPTNPEAIRRLMRLGVKCYFSSRVHMKGYWARDHGCVVASSNLSSQAMAGDKLLEAGVLLAPGVVDNQEASEPALGAESDQGPHFRTGHPHRSASNQWSDRFVARPADIH